MARTAASSLRTAPAIRVAWSPKSRDSAIWLRIGRASDMGHIPLEGAAAGRFPTKSNPPIPPRSPAPVRRSSPVAPAGAALSPRQAGPDRRATPASASCLWPRAGCTRLEAKGKTLTLVLPADLAPLGGARVLRRLGQLGKIAGLEPAIVAE